jgi:hypothetical protein
MNKTYTLMIVALGIMIGCSGKGESVNSRDETSSQSPQREEDADTKMYNQCMGLYNNGRPSNIDAYFDCRNEYNAQGGRRSLP